MDNIASLILPSAPSAPPPAGPVPSTGQDGQGTQDGNDFDKAVATASASGNTSSNTSSNATSENNNASENTSSNISSNNTSNASSGNSASGNVSSGNTSSSNSSSDNASSSTGSDSQQQTADSTAPAAGQASGSAVDDTGDASTDAAVLNAATAALAALVLIANQVQNVPVTNTAPTSGSTDSISEMGGLQANTNPPYPPLAAVHPFLLSADVMADPLQAATTPDDAATPAPSADAPDATALAGQADAALQAAAANPVVSLVMTQNAGTQTSTSDSSTPSKDPNDLLTTLEDMLSANTQTDYQHALPVISASTLTAFLSSSSSQDQNNDNRKSDRAANDNASSPNASTQPATVLNFADIKAHAPSDTFGKLLSTTQHNSAVDQVTVQFKTMAATGTNNIRIQLEPADLGKVEVQMSMTADGKTNVTVTADNRATLQMLQQGARQLEQSLRDVGLKPDAGSLSFNLSGDQQQQQQKFASPNAYAQPAATDDSDQDYYNAVTQVYQIRAGAGVDIRV